MKLELGLNCKKSANGLESSGVNSCTVSTLLLVSKLLRKKKGGRGLAWITYANQFSVNTAIPMHNRKLIEKLAGWRKAVASSTKSVKRR